MKSILTLIFASMMTLASFGQDVIEITFGQRTLKVRVLDVREHALKADAAGLYEVIP